MTLRYKICPAQMGCGWAMHWWGSSTSGSLPSLRGLADANSRFLLSCAAYLWIKGLLCAVFCVCACSFLLDLVQSKMQWAKIEIKAQWICFAKCRWCDTVSCNTIWNCEFLKQMWNLKERWDHFSPKPWVIRKWNELKRSGSCSERSISLLAFSLV